MYSRPALHGVPAGGALAYTGMPLLGLVVAGVSLIVLGASLIRLARPVRG